MITVKMMMEIMTANVADADDDDVNNGWGDDHADDETVTMNKKLSQQQTPTAMDH